MKQEIHPKTQTIKAKCACGAVFNIESTLNKDLELEVCSQCHPFYTGKQNIIDTAGRVDKFKERLAKTKELQEKKPVVQKEEAKDATKDVKSEEPKVQKLGQKGL